MKDLLADLSERASISSVYFTTWGLVSATFWMNRKLHPAPMKSEMVKTFLFRVHPLLKTCAVGSP